MTAPLQKTSGAPVAHTVCATGHSTLKGKPSGAKARHCAFASGAAQQAGIAHRVEVESAQSGKGR